MPAIARWSRRFAVILTLTGGVEIHAAEAVSGNLAPYKGPVMAGVDAGTLSGKVMCGYQGWFGAAGDSNDERPGGRGWRHWSRSGGLPTDGNVVVDLWPDVSELGPDERFVTGFKLADGCSAEVFSSSQKPTVLRHFRWMRDHGIDGAFVQRFISTLRNPQALRRSNTVLGNCREGANRYGRAYAVMYDLSGLGADRIGEVMEDWKALRKEARMGTDPAYLHHRGKPVVAVWGIGFSDHRSYTLAECRRLVEFLKSDPEAGGCTVMLGVPARWRDLEVDAVNDPLLLELVASADIISPWTVGRYRNSAGAADYAKHVLKPDLAWCRERRIDLLPVVFPGFSWRNLKGGQLNEIPRQRGQFLWSQFCEAKRAGASMVYVAMFDEVDEGTAIFKVSNNPPVGQASKFATYEGLPSDFYLRLVGNGARMLRGEIPSSDALPVPQKEAGPRGRE